MSNFARDMLKELQGLLESDDIETLVEHPGTSPAVKVIHQPSGMTVICDRYGTQIENKAFALVQLSRRLQSD